MYSLTACDKLIDAYIEKGGEMRTIKEGSLGLGEIILFGKKLKTSLIKEVYLNEWSSGHLIRKYKKTPKKYLKFL